VANGIRNLEAVANVKADVDSGEVRTQGNTFDEERMRQSVGKGGYIFKGEKNGSSFHFEKRGIVLNWRLLFF